MIVETRYRDIPREEASKCFNPRFYGRKPYKARMSYAWDDLRGKPVCIETPAVSGNEAWACQGPFYHVVGTDFGVCPHIAEIGD